MNHTTARVLTGIHDMRHRLESVGIDSAWVAVPIGLAEQLAMDPSAPDCTLFGMRVMWVDAEVPYIAVKAGG